MQQSRTLRPLRSALASILLALSILGPQTELNGGDGVKGSLKKNAPLRILAIGDSITYGTDGARGGAGYNKYAYRPGAPYDTFAGFSEYPAYVGYGPGYRRYLKDLLEQAGYHFTAYCGTQGPKGSGGDQGAGQYNTLLSPPYDQHEGYPGKRVDHLNAYLFGGTNPDNTSETLPGNDVVAKQQPNVLLIKLGTNDIIQGTYQFGAGSTAEAKIASWINKHYKGIVDEALLDGPSDLHIFCAELAPISSAKNWAKDDRAAARLLWNQALSKLVNNYQNAGKKVFYVKMDNLKVPDDGVHPHQDGYQQMAANWMAAIKSATP